MPCQSLMMGNEVCYADKAVGVMEGLSLFRPGRADEASGSDFGGRLQCQVFDERPSGG